MRKLKALVLLVIAVLSVFVFCKVKSFYTFQETIKPVMKYDTLWRMIGYSVESYTKEFPEDSVITIKDIQDFIGCDTSTKSYGNFAFIYAAEYNFFRQENIRIQRVDSLDKVFVYYELNSAYPIAEFNPYEKGFFDFLFLRKNILINEVNIWHKRKDVRTAYPN